MPVRMLIAALILSLVPGRAQSPSASHAVAFVDASFENASPLWYEFSADGSLQLHLLYDHERASPNRAAGHIYFRLVGQRGSTVTLEFRNLDNVWNGQPGSIARELRTVVVSPDGREWTSKPTDSLPGNRVRLTVTLPGPDLYVARLEPYRLSDLERYLGSIANDPRVEVVPIGRTAAGRPLEIVRIGNPQAPRRIFLRARAHPWEAGSSWVAHGFMERLLQRDAAADTYLRQYVAYIMPMANKDGVARGMTRFNLRGKDLNRNWDAPVDPEFAPENAALERWLQDMIAGGRRPDLAIELHNDGRGLLHISRPPVPQLDRHLSRMAVLERLLRKHTWFTEGSTEASFRNSGTLGDGWLQRYGIDAVVHEFNANWIEGLKTYPNAKHWRQYGASLAGALAEYFEEIQK